jgi:hypothetical protein
MSKSPDGKFEILYARTDDDSYMYSDTDEDWRVVSVATGDELEQFSGSSCSNSSGTSSSGTKSVSFNDAGDAVIATEYDGKATRFDLPASVRVVEKGRKIEITWRDGKIELRDRSPAIFISKYGQPFGGNLVDPPAKEAPAPTKKAAATKKKKKK